ncbi:DUF4856 domain-containing protein [Bacterioplanoides sp. SCSIO 12839]|uniref:DUF4856 domain-containing protein n=1 Tax=Bacterioplanoides sp. SCSIO 12839 TaxID=2829569 RepID=UPI002106A0F3|nr:DUF4856 domain-containing protein [Bacterioplanoides sp. SCSIO 12839]UTW47532.1 DUF4856 domain-containing protein [Bacterioplanoides sp. SCSIO 12839]
MKLIKGISILSAAVLLAACGSDDDDDNDPAPLTTYTFASVVDNQESAVSYSGQVARQALINELKGFIASDALQNNGLTKDQAVTALNRIYAAGTTDAVGNLASNNLYTGAANEATDVNVKVKTADAELLQGDFSELSDDKNLLGKTAGVDNALTLDKFIGWDVDAVAVPGKDSATGERSKPYALIQEWFDAVATLAVVDGETDFVDESKGLDYQQLIQKFLLGSVTYSQAAEDYLKADKGLVKQNSAADKEGKPYTSLEHQWDEGFGYFGAARDYNNYSDADNKSKQDNDTNGDGKIDLNAEYSFGNSVNAAKRDVGSADFTATDFSKNAMDAFLKGRQIIQSNYGTDPVAGEGYHAELVEQAGIALENWEKAIAATVVHYINDTNSDLGKVDSADFNMADLAKHWGEMKGFALGLQFSPITKFTQADQEKMHELMGEQPVFENKADADAYAAKLLEARGIIAKAYNFADNNVANW